MRLRAMAAQNGQRVLVGSLTGAPNIREIGDVLTEEGWKVCIVVELGSGVVRTGLLVGARDETKRPSISAV